MPSYTYQNDIDEIISKRFVNGADFWATADGAVAKGGPYSTLEAGILLSDLGYDKRSPELLGAANVIFGNIKKDGRIRSFSTGAIYPCQTANAAKTLCKLGYADDDRLKNTYEYLLNIQSPDGGWRCNASKFGKGPETESSNPGPTLTVLDIFRYTPIHKNDERLNRAVEFLLNHWVTRMPLGPCHYGIGTLFLQVEFPVIRYNILNYVYVLSFYEYTKKDTRFKDALDVLKSKLIEDSIVIENTNKALKNMGSCKVNKKNEIATRYYKEIIKNIDE